mgnify:CR=1 FL=1
MQVIFYILLKSNLRQKSLDDFYILAVKRRKRYALAHARVYISQLGIFTFTFHFAGKIILKERTTKFVKETNGTGIQMDCRSLFPVKSIPKLGYLTPFDVSAHVI